MIKIHLIVINNVNIYTIYQSLLYNVIKLLPTINQNKTEGPGKMSKFRV